MTEVFECFHLSLISISRLLATDGFPFNEMVLSTISPRVYHCRTHAIYIQRLGMCSLYLLISVFTLISFPVSYTVCRFQLSVMVLFFTFDPPVVDLSPSPWCKVVGGVLNNQGDDLSGMLSSVALSVSDHVYRSEL